MSNQPTSFRIKKKDTSDRLARYAGSPIKVSDVVEFAVEELFRTLDAGAVLAVKNDGEGLELVRPSGLREIQPVENSGPGSVLKAPQRRGSKESAS